MMSMVIYKFEKAYGLMKQKRLFWQQMIVNVSGHCRNDLQQTTLPTRTGTLGHLKSSGPMDLVCIDNYTSGAGNVLTVIDCYPHYALAYPSKDQMAVTVAKFI